MKITRINYNWFFSSENGEEFTCAAIGESYAGLVCVEISEHRAAGEGDKWYYDVEYSDGRITRIFNPNEVYFTTPSV